MNEQELIWSAVLAWVGSKGIQWAKTTAWLPVTLESEHLNKWVARVVALVATIGIHATFDSQAGTLMITGLTTSGVFLALGEYAKQYMMQDIAYKKFVRPEVE